MTAGGKTTRQNFLRREEVKHQLQTVFLLVAVIFWDVVSTSTFPAIDGCNSAGRTFIVNLIKYLEQTPFQTRSAATVHESVKPRTGIWANTTDQNQATDSNCSPLAGGNQSWHRCQNGLPMMCSSAYQNFWCRDPLFAETLILGPLHEKVVSELMTARNYCIISENFAATRLEAPIYSFRSCARCLATVAMVWTLTVDWQSIGSHRVPNRLLQNSHTWSSCAEIRWPAWSVVKFELYQSGCYVIEYTRKCPPPVI